MRRIVKLTAAIICLILSSMVLFGCAKQSPDSGHETKQTDYDVNEVKCVYNMGDQDAAELDVFSSDGTVKIYKVAPYSDSGVNLFEFEIPSDDKCTIKEITISNDEWNNIVNAVKSSDFMDLPEELPKVEAYDGSTCYIEVDTSIGKHKSGGYCAGRGSGKKHERFYSVRSVLSGLTK